MKQVVPLPGFPTYTNDGTTGPRPKRPPQARAARSILIDQFPEFRTFHAYFSLIDVPALTINSGESAWYGLGVVDFPEDVGQEAALISAHIEQLPADVDGAGATSPAAWGDIRGLKAAIAVMLNPPVDRGQWASHPAEIPGVETTSAGLLPTAPGLSPYILTRSFPSGKWTDATPTRAVTSQAFAPLAVRLTEGTRLGVCLVLNRAQAIAAAGDKLNGFASVQLGFGLAKPRAEFQQ